MTAQEFITKIATATSVVHIFDLSNWEAQYKTYSMLIHPDRCSLPDASIAMAKLNEFKDKLENGQRLTDDAGEVTYFTNKVLFKGEADLLTRSLNNYNNLRLLRDSNSLHFQKYMPIHLSMKDGVLQADLEKRAIPLTEMLLDQKHVNWVLSRLLEYCSWLEEVGYVHGGINPESVFIIPENHGLQVCSFYHMAKTGNKAKTISGRYKNWYPSSLFREKTAEATTDIELAKKTAIYLMGDRSGSGVSLKKTHDPAFTDFVISYHRNAHKAFFEYRAMLKAKSESKFHELSI